MRGTEKQESERGFGANAGGAYPSALRRDRRHAVSTPVAVPMDYRDCRIQAYGVDLLPLTA